MCSCSERSWTWIIQAYTHFSGLLPQGNKLQQYGELYLQPPERLAEVMSVAVSEQCVVLLWSTGLLQSFSHYASADTQVLSPVRWPQTCGVYEIFHGRVKATPLPTKQRIKRHLQALWTAHEKTHCDPSWVQVVLKMRFQWKLAGFPKAVPAKTKQPAAIPVSKKRAAAAVSAATVAQPAKQSLPSCILCGMGLLAVAAYVYPSEIESPSQGAMAEMQTQGQQNGVAIADTNKLWTHKGKDSRILSGPVSSASKSMQGKELEAAVMIPRLLQQCFMSMVQDLYSQGARHAWEG